MNLLGLFNSVKTYIITQAINIGKVVLTAKPENIVKAGIFIGSTIYTGYVLITTLKERRNSYKAKKEMSTVDRALALNYADKENRKELSPLFEKIDKAFDKKALKKGLKKANFVVCDGEPTEAERAAYNLMTRLYEDKKKEIEKLYTMNRRPVASEEEATRALAEEIEMINRDMKEVRRMEKKNRKETSFRDILHS